MQEICTFLDVKKKLVAYPILDVADISDSTTFMFCTLPLLSEQYSTSCQIKKSMWCVVGFEPDILEL